ncbi:YrhB domain-containing protein [Streptomyces sp. NPDC001795]|uniref:YrhB domain-containing protein n=1 Tax=Streptomyces sp. NPDC001795 TaxID=3154525 RepID=UPI00331BC3DD
MLTRDEAVAAAAAYLQTQAYPDRPESVVMLPDTAVEFPYGWTVCFDFKEHIETGDPTQAPFSPVMVAPHDGTAAHFAPTFPPTEEYMRLRASGEWPPRRLTT